MVDQLNSFVIIRLIIARSLRKFQTKESTVAKLFAKHIKLKEAIASCKKIRYALCQYSQTVTQLSVIHHFAHRNP